MSITTQQIVESLAAVLGFVPVAVCPGYVAAWLTNLYGFRGRSLVERAFWSVPLSFAIAPIGAVLVGRFTSLNVAVACSILCVLGCVILLAREFLQNRRSRHPWNIGFHPRGMTALTIAVLWVVTVLLLLVDIKVGANVYMSLAIFDHSMRVAWTQSVLYSGIPPANPLYMFKHSAPMRYYYFWYVLCATVAHMTSLPARAVMNASCVWAGFLLAALLGLYLKHFLVIGARLRQQFLIAMGLLCVTGLGICVNLVDFLYFHEPLPGYLEAWKEGQISSWLDSLIWVPHHLASMACAMLGLLLAWIIQSETASTRRASLVFISMAFASSLGLSVYVAFAFFLVMIAWSLWQVVFERSWRVPGVLAISGAGAAVLLAPFLWGLTHSVSNVQGPSVFELDVREMVPPAALLTTPFFRSLDIAAPTFARNLAKAILLLPGYAVELGFYSIVLSIQLIAPWRSRGTLTRAQRALVFISVATLILISFVRSGVIDSNDFGWRAALLLQFSLALLASELLCSWSFADRRESASKWIHDLPGKTPSAVRSLASFALVIGILTTVYQMLMIRFTIPFREAQLSTIHDPTAGRLVHKAYISLRGYAALDSVIPHWSVVQYNPWMPDLLWLNVDWLAVKHQSAVDMDQAPCGSEFGGDPAGCVPMAAAIDALYRGATAAQARATCRQIGIEYLVARIYDPAWKQAESWVWTLRPVVAQPEFRALDCR
ncbi:MAG TPA: hypothetical protein VG893_07380 [Terracidiphilus sp.]|nr:hypothetical protein [Terracidiphilus sp.]